MILLNNVAEEIGWTGFVFARFQDRHGPLRAALLTAVSSGYSTFRAAAIIAVATRGRLWAQTIISTERGNITLCITD